MDACRRGETRWLLADFVWQGRQDSNLRHPVLETGALAN